MEVDRERIADALPAYEIGELLGQGAFGVVVAGKHLRLGRDVAIKQLTPALSGDPDVQARFLAEAKLLASLDHPHIVPVFDFVEHEGICMLVMERLTGGTVQSRFESGGITPQGACAVIVAASAGLQHAHESGVLHRDIKPENLLFSAQNVLKVADFGIAKVVGGATTRATQTGMIIGTPRYMAPEQAQSAELGPMTDVYAAGSVLYELLSGQLPFPPADDLMAAMYQRVHTEPRPLAEAAPDVPEPIVDVVSRSLATDPADRHQSAAEFGGALIAAASTAWGSDWAQGTGVVMRGVDALAGGAAPRKPTTVARPVSGGRGDGRPARRLRIPVIAGVAVAAVLAVVVGLIAFGGGDDDGGSDDAREAAASAPASSAEEVVNAHVEAYRESDNELAATYIADEATILGERVQGAEEAEAALAYYGCGGVTQTQTTEGNRVTLVQKLTDRPGYDCGEFTDTVNTIVYTVVDGKITRIGYG